METGITIRLDEDREEYRPGEQVSGAVRWDRLDSDDKSAELSVLWYTEGKGDQDTGVIHHEEIALDSRREHRVCVALPLLPLTYYGELLKIHWVVRVRLPRRWGRDVLFEMPFALRAGAPAAVSRSAS